MRVIACRSAFGQGGLGQHFAQLVEESRINDELAAYYSHTIKPGDEQIGRLIGYVKLKRLKRYTPLRFYPAWSGYIGENIFDKKVAKELDVKADAFMGFVGKSLHSFKKARKLGFTQLELIAANSHVRNVQRLHRRAAQDLGMKDTWLSEALIRKTMKEYERADFIYTHSEYTRQSLIDEGINPNKLKKTYLKVDDRFVPPRNKPDDGVFRVVYAGRVDSTKGIPLLLEAFSHLSVKKAQLTLVGGWSSSHMKQYMVEWMAKDSRIKMAPGDPLNPFQEADVYVHPTYEDGFAYAPMEALACGVPVIVTEDTGMKEHVYEGKNGYVVPTGSWKEICDRMEYLIKNPLAKTSSMYSSEEVVRR